jgi:hypothetical protein
VTYDDTAGVIDLGADRVARREGKATEIRIRLAAEQEPVVIPVELPVDALAPLKALDLDKDMGLLFQSRDASKVEQTLRDLLTIRPALATDLLAAGKACLERLFCSSVEAVYAGEKLTEPGCDVDAVDSNKRPAPVHGKDCQWPRFVSWRPSGQDYVALIRGLWTAYGASLGEAFTPSASSGSGGATSRRTSNGSTRSTRAASGRTPAPASS